VSGVRRIVLLTVVCRILGVLLLLGTFLVGANVYAAAKTFQIPLLLLLVAIHTCALGWILLPRVRLTRLAHIARLIVTAAWAIVVLTWILSTTTSILLPYGNGSAYGLGSGTLTHATGLRERTMSFAWKWSGLGEGHWGSSWGIWPGGRVTRSEYTPLRPAVIATTIPTIILWLTGRKRHPRGTCSKCGYNLTGNVSGRCPECGKETEPVAAVE